MCMECCIKVATVEALAENRTYDLTKGKKSIEPSIALSVETLRDHVHVGEESLRSSMRFDSCFLLSFCLAIGKRTASSIAGKPYTVTLDCFI